MSVDGVSVRFIWPAEFVQMLRLIRVVGTDLTEIGSLSGNMDATREPIEGSLHLALDPHVQLVVAVGNVLPVAPDDAGFKTPRQAGRTDLVLPRPLRIGKYIPRFGRAHRLDKQQGKFIEEFLLHRGRQRRR